jgi:hypothetical protein
LANAFLPTYDPAEQLIDGNKSVSTWSRAFELLSDLLWLVGFAFIKYFDISYGSTCKEEEFNIGIGSESD